MQGTSRFLVAAVVAAAALAWAEPASAQEAAAPAGLGDALPRGLESPYPKHPEGVYALLARTPIEEKPAAAPKSEGATWDLRATAWSYTTDANVSVDPAAGPGEHFDADFGESIFTGVRLEVIRNRIGALLEAEWNDTRAEDESGDLDLQSRRVDVGLIFRALGVDENGRGLTLDLFGGARYWFTREDFEAGGSDHDDWWTPFVGVETRIPIPFLMDVVGRFQTSGFGMRNSGFDADLTVAMEFGLGPVLVQIGWRFHQVRYDMDPDTEADVAQGGPFLGVGFDF